MDFWGSLGNAIESATDSVGNAYNLMSETTHDAVDLVKKNPSKAALGAAIGVGCVAAAPFTGGGSLLGGASLAASLTGAGLYATAAGAAGAVVSAKAGEASAKDVKESGRKEGYAKAKAEATIRDAQLKEKIERALSETNHWYQAIVAMFTVGISVAACDGHIAEIEKLHIDGFILGKACKNLPKTVRDGIEEKYRNPPSVNVAFNIAKMSGLDMELFDEIICVVTMADSIRHEKEEAYAYVWETLKKSA